MNLATILIIYSTSVYLKFNSQHYLCTVVITAIPSPSDKMRFKNHLHPRGRILGSTEFSRLPDGRPRLNGLADHQSEGVWFEECDQEMQQVVDAYARHCCVNSTV